MPLITDIITELRSCGDAGLTVAELSARLQIAPDVVLEAANALFFDGVLHQAMTPGEAWRYPLDASQSVQLVLFEVPA